MLALALGGCAAGQGQDTDNPFTTAPPHSGTGMQVTDSGSTDSDGVTEGGGSQTSSGGNVTGQVETSITTDPTTEPVDPTENPDPDCT